MGQLSLTNPVAIARSGNSTLLMGAADIGDELADAQTWSSDQGYSDVRSLGVWLKFLYYVEEIAPPSPWSEPNGR